MGELGLTWPKLCAQGLHQVRVKTLPGMWHSLTAGLGVTKLEPLNLQALNLQAAGSRELFGYCMETSAQGQLER